MRGRLPIATFAIVIGALETAGGAQELIFQGIFRSLTYPLIGGTLGTVAGALLLSAGIAMLRGSILTADIARACAYVSVPVFLLIGIVRPLAGVAVTAIGILFPLLLLAYFRKSVREV
jgi:hypothetical protein